MTGKELKNIRIVYNLRQREIADLIDVTISRVSLWEKNNAKVPKDAEKLIREMVREMEKPRIPITHPPRGKEIAQLRKNHGLSQEGLAGMIGVAQSSLSLYEAGEEVPPDVSDSLCEVFGIPYEDKRRKPLRTGSGVRFGW